MSQIRVQHGRARAEERYSSRILLGADVLAWRCIRPRPNANSTHDRWPPASQIVEPGMLQPQRTQE